MFINVSLQQYRQNHEGPVYGSGSHSYEWMLPIYIKTTGRAPAFHAIDASTLKITESLFFLPTIAFYFYLSTAIDFGMSQEGFMIHLTLQSLNPNTKAVLFLDKVNVTVNSIRRLVGM